MLDDTLDMEEDEELEEEADAEVDKVLFSLTDGKLGLADPVNTELPVSFLIFPTNAAPQFIPQSAETAMEDQETEQMEKYREQLDGLLST